MLTLFGHPVSTCTRKVLMTLEETKTPYELSVIDFATAAHKKEPHLSRQPFGQIPAIDDDGFALYESRAISRYLAEKAKSTLIPSDPKARAVMEQWISIETSNFTPHAMKFVYNYAFKRPQDAAVLETAGAGLEKALGIMDAALAKTPFLAGQTFTLADVVYMPYVDYLMGSPVKDVIAKFPHVTAWWQRVSDRPAWAKASGRA
jgi:glutathione S-transferase